MTALAASQLHRDFNTGDATVLVSDKWGFDAAGLQAKLPAMLELSLVQEEEGQQKVTTSPMADKLGAEPKSEL